MLSDDDVSLSSAIFVCSTLGNWLRMASSWISRAGNVSDVSRSTWTSAQPVTQVSSRAMASGTILGGIAVAFSYILILTACPCRSASHIWSFEARSFIFDKKVEGAKRARLNERLRCAALPRAQGLARLIHSPIRL